MTVKREKGLALLRQGLPVRKVAEEVGVSVTSAKKWKREAGVVLSEVADGRPHRERLLDNLCRAADSLTRSLATCEDVHLKSEGVRALADAVKSVGDGKEAAAGNRGVSITAMMAKIQGRIEEMNG